MFANPVPVAMFNGNTFTVMPTGSLVAPVTDVVLTNSSPYTLYCVSTSGAQLQLPAWTKDIMPVSSGNAAVTITPSAPVTLAASQAFDNSLLVSWVQPSDVIPAGTYPQSFQPNVLALVDPSGNLISNTASVILTSVDPGPHVLVPNPNIIGTIKNNIILNSLWIWLFAPGASSSVNVQYNGVYILGAGPNVGVVILPMAKPVVLFPPAQSLIVTSSNLVAGTVAIIGASYAYGRII